MRAILLLALLLCPALARAEAPVTLFAAASLTNALHDIAALWQAAGHPAPRLVLGSSATLARQIEAGAPADLFVSADEKWMDDAQSRSAIVPATRQDLLGNTLVLVVPAMALRPTTLGQGWNPDSVLGPAGRLAVGDPKSVPAGIYAEQALRHLGAWDRLQSRLAPAEDVRAALLLVQRGEAPAGIVYGTDVKAAPGLATLATFPADSHQPIRYPAALTPRGAADQGAAFLVFLESEKASLVFRHYGFEVLGGRIE